MFITETDFSMLIKSDNLESVIRSNPAPLESAINASVSEMQSYLSTRFDVSSIFSTTGTERHPVLVMYCGDIALYHLHAAFAPVKIPAIRVERYRAAIDWLKMVARGELNPGLPAIVAGSSGVNWGKTSDNLYSF